MYQAVGVFNGEGPPVPIPNTAVKLTSADNTCLETDREDRSTPTQRAWEILRLKYASLAQSVEHAAVNRGVVGSSPTWGAIFSSIKDEQFKNPWEIKGFYCF